MISMDVELSLGTSETHSTSQERSFGGVKSTPRNICCELGNMIRVPGFEPGFMVIKKTFKQSISFDNIMVLF